MIISQVSVFVENEFGRLSETLNVLKDNGINIRALCMAETTDYGILRLIVDDTDKAVQALRSEGMMVMVSDVLSLPIDDRPGGLAALVDDLKDNGLSIEYLYAFISHEDNKANVVFRVDNKEKAAELFKGE